MKTNVTPGNIDEYIAGFPRPVQSLLKQVRSAIRKALPRAEEAISYKIPTYKLNGRSVIYFSGWKEHYSLYPADARVIAAFKPRLAKYEYNGKGTLRFPLNEPVPGKLIADIAKFLAKDVAGKAKQASKSKR